ncbi:hypothetical protein G9A89_011328 [Geosiphon pyriformis]|nr:hypothetical protein G9A89_011328 [Geosiphon pyriformis]
MSKKKDLKMLFMKKKVVLGNIKHSSNKRDIFLSKSGPNDNVYFDVESLFGDDKNVSMFGINGESLLDLTVTTFKIKQVNTGAVFGFPFSSSNFYMNDDKVKSFILDINLSAIEEKSATAKTQLIRKIFLLVNGFGGATIFSKFKEIIRSTFTSEKSMEMAMSLAREKEINVNSNFRRQGIRSDQAVVIKKIPMNTPKNIIIVTQKAVVKFAELDQANLLASKWSFLIGKNSVYITKAVRDCEIWVSKDWFRMLLFTLPVNFFGRTGGKTCIINKSIETGNKICYAVVGFNSNNNLESAFYMELILSNVKLSWAKIDLVWCKKCGRFGHSALKCNAPVAFTFKSLKAFKRVVSDECHFQLAKLYEKKSVPISHSAAFGSKSWAQVVLLAGFSDGLHFISGSGSPFSGILGLNSGLPLVLANNLSLNVCLVSLEQSLKLLTDQVSGIVYKLTLSPSSKVLAIFIAAKEDLTLDMIVNSSELILLPPSFAFFNVFTLSLSSLKVLITKVGSLESKLMVFKTSVGLVLAKLDYLCAGLSLLLSFSSQ